MDKIENLLQQVSIIQKKYDEIAKITGENFNIFSIMRAESDEVRTHSRIIAELLNPKGIHSQGSVFLKLFFEAVLPLNDFKENFDYENAQVLVEEHIGRIDENYSEGGFIDIVIKDSKNQLVIENKIYACDQKGQLLRYKKKYPNCKLIYLTLNGKQPSEFSYKIGNGQDLKLEDVILLCYKDVIKNWIEKCLEKTHSLPIIRETLVQYLYLIKKLTNQTTNNKMSIAIKELILKNTNSSKEIYNNINELNKELENKLDMLINLSNKLDFKDDIDSTIEEMNLGIEWEISPKFPKGMPMYTYTFYRTNNLPKIITEICITDDFTIEAYTGTDDNILKNILENEEILKYREYDYSIDVNEISKDLLKRLLTVLEIIKNH